MTAKEMLERARTCADHPLNKDDIIVVNEIWMATIEICRRLELLGVQLGCEGLEMENTNDSKEA
jgi:hypothetical protein